MDDFVTGYEGTLPNRTNILDSIPADLFKIIEMLSEIPYEREREAAIKNMILILKIYKDKQTSTNNK